MKKIFSISLFSLILSSAAFIFSQTPTTMPPKRDDKDVVRISTTLVQIDATVTDKKGSIVRDLKPGDFEIYQNGKRQKITNFSFITNSSEKSESQPNQPVKSDKSAIPIPIPPVKIRPEQVRHTYAMVVDDLGLSFASIDYVKSVLKKFVNEQMQDGDLVAIIRAGSGLGALQSFTNDKRILLAAIDRIHWNGNSRVGVYSYAPLERAAPNSVLSDPLLGFGQGDLQSAVDPTAELNNRNSKNSRDSIFSLGIGTQRQSNIVVGTIGALNYIIRGMSELPGRKAVMLFSEGFQTIDYSKNTIQTTGITDELNLLANFANRSSVSFYTFDPRGIDVPMKEAIDDVGISGAQATGRFAADEVRYKQERDTKQSLRDLADQTGGLAYVDLNKMDQGIQKAINDQTGYYLIGYQPDEGTFDPNMAIYNKLEVKLSRPDLKIRYRNGFFAVTNENLKKVSQDVYQQLNAAITSPFGATGVNLDLYSVFFNDEKNKYFIRSFVKIAGKDLTFIKQPDGKYKSQIQLFAMTFGDNGSPVDQTIQGYDILLDEKSYQTVLQKGFVYDFPLALKNSGAYQFRIALRDMGSGNIGSASQFVEVPDVSKKNFTLSNLIVKAYSLDEWKKISAGQSLTSDYKNSVYIDTTARQFKRGSVMNYSYIIYNSKANSSQFQVLTRLYRDGKLFLEGQPKPLVTNGQLSTKRIEISDAITLGTDIPTGDYILQVILINGQGSGKSQFTTQSIDFEVTE